MSIRVDVEAMKTRGFVRLVFYGKSGEERFSVAMLEGFAREYAADILAACDKAKKKATR